MTIYGNLLGYDAFREWFFYQEKQRRSFFAVLFSGMIFSDVSEEYSELISQRDTQVLFGAQIFS